MKTAKRFAKIALATVLIGAYAALTLSTWCLLLEDTAACVPALWQWANA